jgi:hypothetical protein
MRAQRVSKPVTYSWLAGVTMPVPVDGTLADGASLRSAHNAQDARRTGLQHINNNHPDATAKDPQPSGVKYGCGGTASR